MDHFVTCCKLVYRQRSTLSYIYTCPASFCRSKSALYKTTVQIIECDTNLLDLFMPLIVGMGDEHRNYLILDLQG